MDVGTWKLSPVVLESVKLDIMKITFRYISGSFLQLDLSQVLSSSRHTEQDWWMHQLMATQLPSSILFIENIMRLSAECQTGAQSWISSYYYVAFIICGQYIMRKDLVYNCFSIEMVPLIVSLYYAWKRWLYCTLIHL